MSGHIRVRGGRVAALLALSVAAAACQAFSPDFAEFGGERVRSLRDRAAQHDAMLELRLELLLPRLMDDAGVDCWLVISDGVSGDPAVAALTVAGTRLEGKGALLLCRDDGALRRFALGRGLGANAGFYEVAEPAAGAPLENLINDRLRAVQPQRIAIDDAFSFAAADGLSAADARWLRDRLEDDLADRLVSARPLVEDFLATQLDVEAPLLAESTRLTVAILEQVLSDQVVVAAGTSLADLDWAVRERVAGIDAELAYPPHAFVYRPGADLGERAGDVNVILQPGDLVFLSAGIGYMGYANRVGRWAYLLPTGERRAPDWVSDALGALADGAGAAATALSAGQGEPEADQAALAAVAGLREPRVALDRVTRLRAGALDPWRPAAVSGSWRPDYRIAADTALVITVQGTITPPPLFEGAAPQPFAMLTLDTALVTAAGGRLVVAAQRTPLLID